MLFTYKVILGVLRLLSRDKYYGMAMAITSRALTLRCRMSSDSLFLTGSISRFVLSLRLFPPKTGIDILYKILITIGNNLI